MPVREKLGIVECRFVQSAERSRQNELPQGAHARVKSPLTCHKDHAASLAHLVRQLAHAIERVRQRLLNEQVRTRPHGTQSKLEMLTARRADEHGIRLQRQRVIQPGKGTYAERSLDVERIVLREPVRDDVAQTATAIGEQFEIITADRPQVARVTLPDGAQPGDEDAHLLLERRHKHVLEKLLAREKRREVFQRS